MQLCNVVLENWLKPAFKLSMVKNDLTKMISVSPNSSQIGTTDISLCLKRKLTLCFSEFKSISCFSKVEGRVFSRKQTKCVVHGSKVMYASLIWASWLEYFYSFCVSWFHGCKENILSLQRKGNGLVTPKYDTIVPYFLISYNSSLFHS